MYDGTHYNLGIWEENENVKKVFDAADKESEQKVLDLAQLLKDRGEWIDPNLFQLKCCDCGKPL